MRALEKHMAEDCEWMEVVCQYGCGSRFSRRESQDHDCPNQPLDARVESLVRKCNVELALMKQTHESELASLKAEFKQELERKEKLHQEQLNHLQKEFVELKSELCCSICRA